jgi:hypothetical protein
MSESSWRALLTAIGASQIALGLWQIVSPGSFFQAIADFGEQNQHYIRDNATVPLAVGVGLLLAASRPAWRAPVLLITAVWYLAHAVNHLVDIGEADPGWIGPFDFFALLLSGLLFAGLAVRANAAVSNERRG